MIISGKFLKSIFLIFLFLTVLIHSYINRTTINPHYGKVFYKLGRECQNKCSLNKQLSYFQKAVFYDPNLSEAYYELGIIYGKRSQYKEEIDSFQRLTQLDHTNAEAYLKAGVAYLKNGELDRALRYVRQSDRFKPNQPDTIYYLAKVYDQKEMYPEAVYHYVAAIILGSPRLAEICERIWFISKIPNQLQMVFEHLMMIKTTGRDALWEEIDQYIKTDNPPGFRRQSNKALQ